MSSAPFHALAADWEENGFSAHATRLQSVLDGVWITSSEFVGEPVMAIRKEGRPVSTNQKKLVKECLGQVRKA